ncbi:GNAT family N-acetyltransferase [Neorhizobium petrolearium]|uniref:GNAT family N-acetyltransferase n=1 Tax=Neorhizobium petrolearium TaxID=515361 RepID=UPI003F5CEE10
MIEIMWGGSALNPELHAAMVSYVDERIGNSGRGFGHCKTMGVFENGDVLGVIVFHNWNPESQVIEISAAADSPRWLRPTVLNRIFRYAFDDIGCQLVVARMSEDNEHTQRIFRRYGFQRYLIPRLRGRDEDEWIFTLTDDAWRGGKFHRG